jgi:hypothetical protein
VELTNDTVVNTVIQSFILRSNLGFKKYGQTMDRTDLTPQEWANHMQEELMDAILYLERLKRDLASPPPVDHSLISPGGFGQFHPPKFS